MLSDMKSMITLAALSASTLSAQIVPGIRNYDLADFATIANVPKRLSETGLYANIASPARTLSDPAAIIPFEVNSALWSDGSHKERFVSLPPGAARIVPTDTSQFTFPPKTVLVKNFMIDTVQGDPATRILIETRFLVYQSDSTVWSGLSYRWRRDQTDADLVDLDNGEDVVHGVRVNGVLMGKRWRYPSFQDCTQCHSGTEKSGRGTLGFITPQLNRTVNGVNQLQRLVTQGVLSVNPVAAKPNAHRWHSVSDASATLEQRVRSYFAANCSHCHGNTRSWGQAAHNFDYFDPAKKITTAENPTEGWVGAHPMEMEPLVAPGHPDSSMIMKKMMDRIDFFRPSDANQMPPLATAQPDSGALAVIKSWICSLKPGTPCAMPEWLPDDTFWADASEITPSASIRQSAGRRDARLSASYRHGILSIPQSSGRSEAVALRDYLGRDIPLQRVGNGEFRVQGPLNPGVYILTVGSRRAYLSHLP